jgi:predicted hotdog family 3-hydroxylacyl-ACP dehydratase
MINIPVIELIPQRSPMLMIGQLVDVTPLSATTTFTISTPNIFIEENCFTESGMVENIAQTAAAMVGYQCRSENKLIPVGYIAALKNLVVRNRPAVDSTIKTTVTVTNNVLDVTIVQGVVEQDGKILCHCELRILIRS